MNFRQSILLVAFIALSPGASAQKKNLDTAFVQTMIYCDHCKVCESCGGKLEKELFFEKGIKRLELDEKAMKLMVVYDPKKITLDKIRQEIAKLGFDADDVKADPAAVAKLDECCRKQ